MKDLYKELFPHGTLMYSLDELNALSDKLSHDVVEMYNERDIQRAALVAITNSETYEEYLENCRDSSVLTELPLEDKKEYWSEYWEGKHDEAVENEVDDFRLKEDDMVK